MWKYLVAAMVAACLLGTGVAGASVPRDPGGSSTSAAGLNDAAGGYDGIREASGPNDAADGYTNVGRTVVVTQAAPAPRALVVTNDVGDGWKVATVALGALLLGVGAFGAALFVYRRKPVALVEPELEPEPLA